MQLKQWLNLLLAQGTWGGVVRVQDLAMSFWDCIVFVGQTLLAYSASLHIEVFLMSIGGLSWKPMKMREGNQWWTDFRGVGSYSSFSLAYGGISYLFFLLKKGVKHVLVSASLKPLPCYRCTHSTMIHTN